MTDILSTCPRCGMQHGQCVHATDGSLTIGESFGSNYSAMGESYSRAQYNSAIRDVNPTFVASLPRLSEHDVADDYSARSGTVGQPPLTLISARPQPADAVACTAPIASAAAGGTGSNKPRAHLYDPKCRELAEYFGTDRHDRDLTDVEIDELAHDIQLCVEGYINLLDSEGLR